MARNRDAHDLGRRERRILDVIYRLSDRRSRRCSNISPILRRTIPCGRGPLWPTLLHAFS
jgi:hypothetical protein